MQKSTATFSDVEIAAVRDQLSSLEGSVSFAHADRMLRFLRYVTEEVIAGRGNRLNQKAVGIEVFDRDGSFDPAVDSVVRVEASRLRAKLREYYDGEGKDDRVRFELPKGSYQIIIHLDRTADAGTGASYDLVKQNAAATAGVEARGQRRFSIVILPFEGFTGDPRDEALVDGITTEVILAVGRTGSFDVASHHSSFAYKGLHKDTREIGQELDVNYVLEGSVRRAGQHARVAIALIDTRSNRQVWANSYDYELLDALDLQDQVGRTVASTLSSILWRASMEEAQRNPTGPLDAADFVDRANAIFFNYSPSSFDIGKELVRSLRGKDRHYGHADALLAFILTHEMANAWADDPRTLHTEALAAADRALDLDPRDSWVLGVTSEALIWLGQARRAVHLCERAVAGAADNLLPFSQARLGNALLHTDRGEEGLEQIERSFSAYQGEWFIPPWHHLMRCWALTHLQRYDEAVVAGRMAVDRQTGTPLSSQAYANALVCVGDIDEARLAFYDLRRMCPRLTLDHLEWLYRNAFTSKQIAERYIGGLRELDWLD